MQWTTVVVILAIASHQGVCSHTYWAEVQLETFKTLLGLGSGEVCGVRVQDVWVFGTYAISASLPGDTSQKWC